MPDIVPLFPLDVVLLPGAALPLHIFEPRYRQLLHDITVDGDGPGRPSRRFALVWQRPDGTLADISTMAEVLEVAAYRDGRSDLLTVGSRRFRLLDVDAESRAYLQGTVEWLAEPVGDFPAERVRSAHAIEARYAEALTAVTGRERTDEPLSNDPLRLSYQLAERLRIPNAARQELLEIPAARERLIETLRLMTREAALLRHTRSVPISPHVLQVDATSN